MYSYEGWLTFYRLCGIEGDVMPNGKTHYCGEKCLRMALDNKSA